MSRLGALGGARAGLGLLLGLYADFRSRTPGDAPAGCPRWGWRCLSAAQPSTGRTGEGAGPPGLCADQPCGAAAGGGGAEKQPARARGGDCWGGPIPHGREPESGSAAKVSVCPGEE
ncbi:RMDN3 isoform 5 [Pongo abelii]|uniref:RMDN3 isoform 5 n=1 Tax=Pongo abelii TaxID=9601 RepID=A0A2J8S618_PONAB|nr:RMDN3 isoform 5 [Pongo abelii]